MTTLKKDRTMTNLLVFNDIENMEKIKIKQRGDLREAVRHANDIRAALKRTKATIEALKEQAKEMKAANRKTKTPNAGKQLYRIPVRERLKDSPFMSMGQVLQEVPVSRSSIYKMMERGDFPKPKKLSQRSAAWSRAEINAWIEEKLK